MKIAFFEIEGWEEEVIKKRLGDVYLSKETLNEDNLPEDNSFEIISVFGSSRVTDKVLGHFPNLKFLTTRSTGFDHIDLEACKKRNIPVAYVPGYGDNTVAEFAFGLILNLTRKIYAAVDRIKETGSFQFEGLRGTDLKGKTLGVVGTGRIGKEAIKIAKGFGMKVVATDVYPDEKFAKEQGYEYIPLEKLLSSSDVITIHCPYTKETHHLINKDNVRLIKKGAYLVNTARGGIVETEALVLALQEGILAGAGLDVLEEEVEVKEEMVFAREKRDSEEMKVMLEDHVLMRMPNVLITPHTAFNSQEAVERILAKTLENIEGFLAGKPVNLVK
ncbi:MAG: NAD(P)-dependent oxidoreductase [Candidatus Jorgensenbacteria bacterium]